MGKKLTYKEFSKKFNEVWKGELELIPETELDYKNLKSIIRVKCPVHGTIKGNAFNYLQGHGCRKCYEEKQRLPYEEYSKRFNEVWKGKLELIPETELDYEKTTSIIRVKCPVHGTIKGRAFSYLQGHGCKKCTNENRGLNKKLPYKEYSKRFNEVQKGKLELIPETELDYEGTRCIIRVKCPVHGTIKGWAFSYLRGNGCRKCADEKQRLPYEEYSKRFNEIWKGKLELIPETELDYKGTNNIIRVKCPVHGTIKGHAYNYLQGKGCKMCANDSLKLPYEEYSKRFNEVWKGKLELIPETELDYEKTNSIIRVKCPVHGTIKGNAFSYLQGHGCRKCYEESLRLPYEEFCRKFNEVQKGKLELISETELDYKGTKSIIRVKCPIHGTIKGIANNYLQGQGCSICSQGNMEKLVRELLEANNIRFEQFYRGFDWLRFNPKYKQHLDFWLPNYNIAIEVQDADQHLYDKQYIERDKNKLKLCKEHGVTLIYFSTANFNFPYYVIKDTKTLIDEIKKIGVTNQP